LSLLKCALGRNRTDIRFHLWPASGIGHFRFAKPEEMQSDLHFFLRRGILPARSLLLSVSASGRNRTYISSFGGMRPIHWTTEAVVGSIERRERAKSKTGMFYIRILSERALESLLWAKSFAVSARVKMYHNSHGKVASCLKT
jgi:hypothetical protein